MQNRADRSSPPRIQANISSYPAVYAEIYCLAKFIISIYSFRAYARRGGAGGQQTTIDGPLSHIARRKGTSR
ncbi:hypothetical protein FKK16_03960 [Klebsiella pneumoniae]|uniref:Uncharacterized protein n=2 Tax=Klebsiella pneumoniae TaxID=573 RepID=A0A483M822_KLEPN|nr:hypothetical protein GCK98_26110 [Klebsiella pneumoniae]OYG26515.1 hypothetical protein CI646_03720 [Klebsiella pneumoniae subsp. pneumoniae]PXK70231.1 hypothetical protein DMS13_00470 [Klebsiella variicola]KAB8012318.1 hypothetical protein GCL02_14700 [Klebsiella pneumoniae]KAB8019084.1 hypothetical protein GCL03_27925 [Klebsiella pneumoniae]